MSKKAKSKAVLPKRIAGIKIPKKLRRKSGSLLALAQTPVVSEILVSALVAAAAAISQSNKMKRKARMAGLKLEDMADSGAHKLGKSAQAAAGAVTEAVGKLAAGVAAWGERDETDAGAPPRIEPRRGGPAKAH